MAMKWVGISGSWRYMNNRLQADVRLTVDELIKRGHGVMSGGAPGVDYTVVDSVLHLNPDAKKLRVFLPTSLNFYINHNMLRARENPTNGLVFEALNRQLATVYDTNKDSIIEGYDIPSNIYVTKQQYFDRNDSIVEESDKLIAFHVNKTEGTKDAIDKARLKGIPVIVYEYEIKDSFIPVT